MTVTPPHGRLEIARPDTKVKLSRLAKTGNAMRLATGIYAVGAILPPEDVARQHRFELIARFWPNAVICGRSALAGAAPVDGVLYLATPDGRQAPLVVPGITFRPVPGPGPLPGDTDMPAGVHMSGPARTIVENITVGPGRPPSHRAGLALAEDRIDAYARSGGAGRIRTILDQLDVIAGSFDPAAVAAVRDRLVAVLGTFSSEGTPQVESSLLAARIAGHPYDGHRVVMIEQLIEVLTARPPTARPATPPMARWEWLPFFESYFSNFIEGTEFGVDEARRIAIDGVPFAGRLEDAHDIIATYRLAADPSDRVRVPNSGAELVEILRDRHRILMAARPEKHPGEFKQHSNFAGGYEFVAPELVVGTLARGFATLDHLHDPLSRAVAMMALVTECHPFDDGNGRVARLTANAELSAAGEVRTVIPTVYRSNYLSGLGALSNGTGKGAPLVAVLEFAQRWTGAIDWSDYDAANAILTTCHAFEDPTQAEATGHRLQMPA